MLQESRAARPTHILTFTLTLTRTLSLTCCCCLTGSLGSVQPLTCQVERERRDYQKLFPLPLPLH